MHSRYMGRNFGVLEIIVSVAILAAFSVPVLHLFVSAAGDEKKMRELDRAGYAAVSCVEQFKAGAAPYALSAALGGAAPVSGDYTAARALDGGLCMNVRIAKGTDAGTGALYSIHVTVTRSSDGSSVYSLEGSKYFSAAG